MSIDEAINYMEALVSNNTMFPPMKTASQMAIDALRAQKEEKKFNPPCYQPDGDGCAYQCYDGQDEPIDKCKECPLCFSDKQRHHET